MISSGKDEAGLGVELLANCAPPFAWVKDKPVYLRPADFRVLSYHSRRLVVSVQAPYLNLVLAVVNSPHNGYAALALDLFWGDLQSALAFHPPDLVCIDANARLGSETSPGAGSEGTCEIQDKQGERTHNSFEALKLVAANTVAPQRPQSGQLASAADFSVGRRGLASH